MRIAWPWHYHTWRAWLGNAVIELAFLAQFVALLWWGLGWVAGVAAMIVALLLVAYTAYVTQDSYLELNRPWEARRARARALVEQMDREDSAKQQTARERSADKPLWSWQRLGF